MKEVSNEAPIGPRVEVRGPTMLWLPPPPSIDGPTTPLSLPIVQVVTDEERPSDDDWVPLRQGFSVRREFHDRIFALVQAAIPHLPLGKELKVDDFFEPRYWREVKDDHWTIGCCLSHWVHEGLLPLRFVGCERCSKKRYLRT